MCGNLFHRLVNQLQGCFFIQLVGNNLASGLCGKMGGFRLELANHRSLRSFNFFGCLCFAARDVFLCLGSCIFADTLGSQIGIGNVLEQRGRTIQDDLNRAKEAEAEAQAMKAEFEASLDDARTKAADAAQKAMSEAKAKAEESEAELSAKLAKKTKAAEAKLAKIRDEALANINEVASEVTQDAVKAVTGMTVTKAEATKSVAKLAKAGAGQEA